MYTIIMLNYGTWAVSWIFLYHVVFTRVQIETESRKFPRKLLSFLFAFGTCFFAFYTYALFISCTHVTYQYQLQVTNVKQLKLINVIKYTHSGSWNPAGKTSRLDIPCFVWFSSIIPFVFRIGPGVMHLTLTISLLFSCSIMILW